MEWMMESVYQPSLLHPSPPNHNATIPIRASSRSASHFQQHNAPNGDLPFQPGVETRFPGLPRLPEDNLFPARNSQRASRAPMPYTITPRISWGDSIFHRHPDCTRTTESARRTLRPPVCSLRRTLAKICGAEAVARRRGYVFLPGAVVAVPRARQSVSRWLCRPRWGGAGTVGDAYELATGVGVAEGAEEDLGATGCEIDKGEVSSAGNPPIPPKEREERGVVDAG
jgi:hypothetical protein